MVEVNKNHDKEIHGILFCLFFRYRMDYYHCMKNASATCSYGFTSQLQTMFELSNSMLMHSGQCPDDVMEQNQRMYEEMYMDMMYGPARNDLSIKLVMGMIAESVHSKQGSDGEREEMDKEENDMMKDKDEDDNKKDEMEKDEMMKDDDEQTDKDR